MNKFTPRHRLHNQLDRGTSMILKSINLFVESNLLPIDEAFLRAVEQSDVKMIRSCLARNADVNVTREEKATGLHIAAEKGDVEVMKVLLQQKNVQHSTRTVYGYTALYLAAQAAIEDVVVLLLNAGANVNRADQMGRTPLHAATFQGHFRTVVLLVRNGADINAQDAFGDVPLYVAIVTRPHPKIAKFLIKNGANPNLRGHDSMGIFLEAVLNANQMKQTNVVEMLVRNGVYINTADPVGGRTALHLAAMTGDLEMVECLISLNADISLRNFAGKTALDIAKIHENYAVHSLLMSLTKRNAQS